MPTATHDGVAIGYDVVGEGRPIMLLHGWATDRSWWMEFGFVDALVSGHQVITVDLRGHGRSSAPQGRGAYRGEEQVRDVLAVADAVGVDRFTVWGLSLGGWVGWFAAMSAPERVQALVTTGQWDLAPRDEAEGADNQPLLTILRRGDMASAIGLVQEEAASAASGGFVFPPAILAVIGRSDPIALADCLEEHDSSGIADFATLAAPTLLISGELEDPDDEAAGVAARLQHGEHFWLPQLGHAGAGAASDLTVPAVRAFLDRWMAPNTTG